MKKRMDLHTRLAGLITTEIRENLSKTRKMVSATGEPLANAAGENGTATSGYKTRAGGRCPRLSFRIHVDGQSETRLFTPASCWRLS